MLTYKVLATLKIQLCKTYRNLKPVLAYGTLPASTIQGEIQTAERLIGWNHFAQGSTPERRTSRVEWSKIDVLVVAVFEMLEEEQFAGVDGITEMTFVNPTICENEKIKIILRFITNFASNTK